MFYLKKWSNKSTQCMTESFILELIRHYYPNIEIDNDKYVLNTANKLWDKHSEVINAIDAYKLYINESEYIPTLCSMYEFYINTCNTKSAKIYIASKRYFEKIAIEELGSILDIDGIIHYNAT